MLVELAVRDLGVIARSSLVLGPGMTALTGETGAGKTMIVQAIHLLTGGRADASVVREGCEEAVVEGRFVIDDLEIVLRRVVPRSGRSRAYVDGTMATAATLAEEGARLVDLHGQHEHQSLLSRTVQRGALDRYGGIDTGPLRAARSRVTQITGQLDDLGGDARARAHEIDLLVYQQREIDDAEIIGPGELGELEDAEELLGDATENRVRAGTVRDALAGDDGVVDRLGDAASLLGGRTPFAGVVDRLRAVAADIDDVVDELRALGETIEDDPERLAGVRARRQTLLELTRKYGDTLDDVIAYRGDVAERLDRLQRHEELAAELEQDLAVAEREAAAAAKHVAEQRRIAAPDLGRAVTAHLEELALGRAEVTVSVAGDDPADDVELLFAANSGAAARGLGKVASGGELARVMLALRLVLTAGPPTLVFDEVDAGIGGEAAVAVGRSLGRLGASHQVLVVTHLPQVAAFADRHYTVSKHDDGTSTTSALDELTGDDRVTELARMLAGRPDSDTGRGHAAELLELADAGRADR